VSAEKYAERVIACFRKTRSPFDEADYFIDTLWQQEVDALSKAIAALCAEIEAEIREACAKVADDYAAKMAIAAGKPHPWTGRPNTVAECKQDAGESIAAAIRAGKP